MRQTVRLPSPPLVLTLCRGQCQPSDEVYHGYPGAVLISPVNTITIVLSASSMSNSSNPKSLHPRGHGSGTPVKKAPVRGPTPTRPAPALPRTARGKSGVVRPVPPVATFPSRTVPDLRHTRPSATYAAKVARTVTTGNIAQPASKRQGLIAASKHVRTASLPVASKASTAANKSTRSPRPTSLPEVGKENTVPSFARPTRTSSARVQPAVERAPVKLTLRPSRPLQSPTKSTRPPFKRVSNDKPLPVTPPAASARSFSISRSGDDASTLSIGEEPKQGVCSCLIHSSHFEATAATPHNKQVPDEIIPPPVPEKDGVPLHVLVKEMLAGKATAAIPWPLYEMPTTPPTTPSCPEHPAAETSLPAALPPAETIIPETIPSPVSPSVQPTVPETNQESDDEKADPPAIVITRPTSAPLEQFITPDGIIPITTELSKNDLLSPDCEPKVLASRRTIDFKLPSAAELLKKRSAAKAKRLETAQRQRPSKKFTAQLDLLEEEYENPEDTSTMQTIVQQEDSTSPSATIHHPEQVIRSFFEDDDDLAKPSNDDYDGLLPELIDDLIGTDSEEELTAIDGRFATCLENLDNADIDFPNLSRAINTRILTADSEDNYWSIGHRELLHALGSLSACVQDIEGVLNDDIT
ncbi:uncharacterized protein LAESUDRAFT_471938 [Laetiporus sulphureus 93-53]|uniref:Uncharacterized protein n=1 Tax=Laetiporus sulphureus 93-53 TaxID=1314785 RepID=A0A165GAV5_9APHY|nr:uncharacterized protein LAESUDRAFT_471938 [Laetiporus sulphureus 93-53]KZT10087.1 hypothetical protein LAESUDRAFT_471938 [Laetiporus sulphureus 93-53]